MRLDLNGFFSKAFFTENERTQRDHFEYSLNFFLFPSHVFFSFRYYIYDTQLYGGGEVKAETTTPQVLGSVFVLSY